ncbi:MAG: NAD-dependent epimerase/dehydratase family protein, partial [Actinomycetales bacterium]
MKHLVIGAGQIGPHVARRLAEAGETVTVATRSGRGPADLTNISLDATDGLALRTALEDVDVLYLCLHASAYRDDAWRRELPPLERTVLAAAEATGTTVVFPESLYAFDASTPISATSRVAPRSPLGEVRKILLEPKPFAVGFRIEHPQPFIDRTQYHLDPGQERPELLPAARYRLATKIRG